MSGVMSDIEAFTCLMYGYAREETVNGVRSLMLKEMVGEGDQLTTKSKVDLCWLPPCTDNLLPHIMRVNHRLAMYKLTKHLLGAQSPLILDKAGRRQMRVSWSQCGRVAPFCPLL